MKTFKVFVIIILILFLSVPWMFSGFSEKNLIGLPLWVIYSLSVTIIFALVVVNLISRKWEELEKEDDE